MRLKPKVNRGGWLAKWLQKRRRARAVQPAPAPAILLTSDGHGRLFWSYNFATPWDTVNIYISQDQQTWQTYDGWDLADGQRDCSGSAGYFRICICDWDGIDIPPYSNSVYSDGL